MKDEESLKKLLQEAVDVIEYYESAMDSCEGEVWGDGEPMHTILDNYSVYHEARHKADEFLKKVKE